MGLQNSHGFGITYFLTFDGEVTGTLHVVVMGLVKLHSDFKVEL